MNKVNILIGVILGIYALIAFVPLVKSVISSFKKQKKEEWIEEPLMIGE